MSWVLVCVFLAGLVTGVIVCVELDARSRK